MLCGDETNAVVADLGSSIFKFGTSGQNTPTHIFRSEILEIVASEDTKQKFFGDEAFRCLRSEPFSVRSLSSGPLTSEQSTEDLEDLIYYGIHHRMRLNPKDYGLLVSQGKHFTDIASQEKLLEITLESLEIPALFSIPDSILCSIAAGRASSLVVDLGAQGTTITPVVDGYELKKSKLFTPVGGNAIDQAISNYLYEQKVTINPLSTIFGKKSLPTALTAASTSASANSSYSNTSINYHPKYYYSNLISAMPSNYSKAYFDCLYYDIVKDVKGWMMFIPHYSLANEYRSAEGLNQAGVYLPPFYELPDGTQVSSSYPLSTLAESLFFPEHNQSGVYHPNSTSTIGLPLPPPTNNASNSGNSASNVTNPGLNTSHIAGKRVRELIELDHQSPLFTPHSSSPAIRIEEESLSDLIYLTISRCDVDVRKDLLSNILLCGGTSLISGLSQRLLKELNDITPSHLKTKIINNLSLERQYSTWIGGSILAICGTFNQMWISKKEYDEYGGLNIAKRRFYF
eukprot:gene15742-17674_t